MENIIKNWRNLKTRILDSEMENKKYILNFWEKEGIVKPYSKLVLGNESCDIYIDRDIFDPDTFEYCGHIHIDMKKLVYDM